MYGVNDLPASGPPTGDVAHVMRRWGTLNRIYNNHGWMQHYQGLANNIMPRKGRYLKSQDINAMDRSAGLR